MIPIQNQSVIRIVAAFIQGNVGHVLLVRKRGALKFMQRGCKVHDGESPLAALERELREELMFCGSRFGPSLSGHLHRTCRQ